MILDQDIEKLHSIFKEFARVSSAEPYDHEAANAVMEKLREFQPLQFPRRRRRPWAAVMFVLCLVLVLLYIVWEILFNLKIMDSP